MLTSYNWPLQLLVPRLATTKGQMAAPGGGYSLRTALVRHNVETTYVVPGDWPAQDGSDWFHDQQAPAAGSDVEYLIDGELTFEAMLDAMETADSAGHFIVLLGWSLQHNVALFGGKTFLQVVEERASLKVAVRVLLFDNVAYPINGTAKNALNGLREKDASLDVRCCLDDNTKGDIPDEGAALLQTQKGVSTYGSHHHKILVVSGREGLISFCGGIDPDSNRLGELHDVHVRVTGEAAKDLLTIAQQRWKASKDNELSPVPADIATLAFPPAPAASGPRHLCRVVQTVGNPDLSKTISNTLWPAVQRGIAAASRFIYIEDQYFWSLDLVEELVKAAKRVRHITILLPDALIGEQPYKRQRALAELVRQGGAGIEQKIGVFQRKRGNHPWVHAKLFVFDDEYAIVGSANANNRGYFLDSEAAVCVAEREWRNPKGPRQGAWSVAGANLARRMRMELWREHLGLETDELFDGLGARAHWDLLPASAAVSIYTAVDLMPGPRGGAREVWWKAPYMAWQGMPQPQTRLVDPKE